MTRYLHDELLLGIPARTLLAETEEQVRERGQRLGREGEAETAVALRRWLLDGRRVVLLSAEVVRELLDSPPVLPAETPSPERVVEVWLEQPIECDLGKSRPDGALPPVMERSKALFLGGFLYQDSLGQPTCVIAAQPPTGPTVVGYGGDLRDDPGELLVEVRLLRAALRALADEKTAWIDPNPKRKKAHVRRDRQAGLQVGRLVLSSDALSVWRRRMSTFMEREGAPKERGPVSPHVVRDHHARVWTVEPRLGEEILADRQREADGSRPATWLYCVSRPRKGGVRGRGLAKSKIDRLSAGPGDFEVRSTVSA